MPTYVAFLRAINLGPTRKFAKAQIMEAVEDCGFTDVETYINTGNVRFTTALRSRAKVEAALEQSFRKPPGFEVPTIVLTPGELKQIAADAEEVAKQHRNTGAHYVSLLKEKPSAADVRRSWRSWTTARTSPWCAAAARTCWSVSRRPRPAQQRDRGEALGVATNRNLKVIRHPC